MVANKITKFQELSHDEAHDIITRSTSPVIFQNMISEWPARHWTVKFLCSKYADMVTKFKVCNIRPTFAEAGPRMETDCIYVNATLKDFQEWLGGRPSTGNKFELFARGEYSIYADYKYMHQFFENDPNMLQKVDWANFGFHGRGGHDSTLWIGSFGAFTPCHQDTYGFNLVAQLTGRKRWTMFEPGDSEKLYPTRIPYEESSIFSGVNLENPDGKKHPKFKDAKRYEVVLEPGDVLFVPKHWWHYVENLEPSVSINTWIENESDVKDRAKEAIVRILVSSLKESEGERCQSWLNPNEEVYAHETNMSYLKLALENLLCKDDENSPESNKTAIVKLTTNNLIDYLVSENVLNALIDELDSKFAS
eukprot:gene3305-3790_t